MAETAVIASEISGKRKDGANSFGELSAEHGMRVTSKKWE